MERLILFSTKNKIRNISCESNLKLLEINESIENAVLLDWKSFIWNWLHVTFGNKFYLISNEKN